MSSTYYILQGMLGTYLNVAAILIGGMLGLLLRKHLSQAAHSIIYTSIGIVSIILGMSMALKSGNLVYIVLSLVIGGSIGQWLKLEERVLNLGGKLWKLNQRILPSLSANEKNKQFAEAFLDASVLFCSGSLAILGPIMAGVSKDYDLLIMKSTMDGIIAIILVAAMGSGVIFSALPVFAYQGSITVLAILFGKDIDAYMLQEVGATGGVLIIFIGARLWNLREIHICNFLPALLVIIFFTWLHPILISFVSGIL